MKTIKEKLNYIIEEFKHIETIIEEFENVKSIIQDRQPKMQIKDFRKAALKKYKPKNYQRHKILKKARTKAHSVLADSERTISNNLKEVRT